MLNHDRPRKIEPFTINQIAQSLFGDRYITIYDTTIQFHNHCYHVQRIDNTMHRYHGHYYLVDANTQLAMRTDIDFAPAGSYGAIFDPISGEIVEYDE